MELEKIPWDGDTFKIANQYYHREEPYLPDVASAFVHFPGGAFDGLDDLGAGHGLHDEGELVARHAEIHYNFT